MNPPSSDHQSHKTRSIIKFAKKFCRFLPIILGLLFVFLGFFADAIGIGRGNTGMLGSMEILIVICGSILILIGLLWPKGSHVLGVNILIITILILIADLVLYALAPILPIPIITKMSKKAQKRYAKYHDDDRRYIYYKIDDISDSCQLDYHGKPYYGSFDWIYSYQYDEFGYRNPIGYISKEKPIDIIFIGDSFVEGWDSAITMAEFLRESLNPYRIYSLGMGHASIYNWKCQYRRFRESKYFRKDPKVIVAHLYGGNDIRTLIELEEAKITEAKRRVGRPDNIINTYPMTRLPFRNELLYILEKQIEIQIVKYAFLPQKNQVVTRVLKAIGIDKKDWANKNRRALTKYREKDTSLVQWNFHEGQIKDFVDMANTLSPETKLILSYIPSASGVCDITILNADSKICVSDQEWQKANSRKIEEISNKFGVHYIDVSPQIREYIQEHDESIYMLGGHFSPSGYNLYSNLIRQDIQKALAD